MTIPMQQQQDLYDKKKEELDQRKMVLSWEERNNILIEHKPYINKYHLYNDIINLLNYNDMSSKIPKDIKKINTLINELRYKDIINRKIST